jgi:hypothetical protein
VIVQGRNVLADRVLVGAAAVKLWIGQGFHICIRRSLGSRGEWKPTIDDDRLEAKAFTKSGKFLVEFEHYRYVEGSQ